MDSTNISINVSALKITQLHEIFRMLSQPYQGKKAQLIERLRVLLITDKERTQRAIVDVYKNNNARIQAALAPFPAAKLVPDPQPIGRPEQLPTVEMKRALEASALEKEQLQHHQGLLEKCRLLGAMVVEKKYPQNNEFLASGLTVDEFRELGVTCKVVVRFAVYNPGSKTHLLPPIWPKEARLLFDEKVVFDTVTKNRFGFAAVGQKDPFPAVDVTELYRAKGSAGVNFKIGFASATIASGVRWVVLASLAKHKSNDQIVREILQRSPPPDAHTKRMLDFFKSADEDLGVEVQELTLKDPASFMPIEIAARGSMCKHLQCFDLFSFLNLNESAREPRWKCPICGDVVEVKSLVTDSWFQGVIEWRNQNMSNATRFTIGPDGQAVVLPEEPDDDDDGEVDSEQDELNAVENKRPRTIEPIDVADRTAVQIQAPRPKKGKSRDDAIELLDDDDVLY